MTSQEKRIKAQRAKLTARLRTMDVEEKKDVALTVLQALVEALAAKKAAENAETVAGAEFSAPGDEQLDRLDPEIWGDVLGGAS